MISFLKRTFSIITTDFAAKIFIICFSAFLWYFVNVFSRDRTIINIPVETVNIPEGIAAVPRDRMTVEVNLRSREDITDSISNIKAYIDLSNTKREGESYYRVRLDGVPEGVFASVLPYSLRIDMDDIIDASVPLSLRTRGANNKNLVIDYKMIPENISVRGPSRVLRRLKSIPTEILDIPSLQATYTQVSLRVQAPEYTKLAADKVNVELWTSLEMFTNLIDVPITFQNIPEGMIVRDELASVLVVSRITNKNTLVRRTKAFVDMENVTKSGKITLPVRIEAIDGVVSNITPKVEVDVFE
ncbi:MAG: CdaR family protein [Brevinema sp.]